MPPEAAIWIALWLPGLVTTLANTLDARKSEAAARLQEDQHLVAPARVDAVVQFLLFFVCLAGTSVGLVSLGQPDGPTKIVTLVLLFAVPLLVSATSIIIRIAKSTGNA